MILLSIAITGLVMMVSVIAIEKLKQATKLQNTQKLSLQNTYQAEEGIEFSLFSAKQGVANVNENSTNANAPLNRFQVSLWDNNNKTEGTQALQQIAAQNGQEHFVISSKNKNNANQNQNKKLEKSAFSNVPSRFYDQVSVWNDVKDYCNLNNSTSNCADQSTDTNTMTTGKQYQIVASVAGFNTPWTSLKYRLIFRCLSKSCSARDLKIGYNDCTTTGTTCPMTCGKWDSLTFWGGKTSMEANVLVSDWFTTSTDLRGKKIVVQFESVSGTLKQIKTIFGPQNEIMMCKGTEVVRDRFGGLTKIDVKKN